MELCSAVKLSSSWKFPDYYKGSLESVLYIKKSSGIILDQPLVQVHDGEQHDEHKIELHRPLTPSPSLPSPSPSPSDQPCYLYIDASHLKGYILTGFEVISSSRTLECYNGRNEEYIGTNRGTMVKRLDNSINLYKCAMDSSDIKSEFTLKLASLYNRNETFLTQVCLIVTENMGGLGEEGDRERESCSTKNDLQDLISDTSSVKGPPLLPKLLATLQQLQHAQTTTRTDMNEMMSFFRQMRPNLDSKTNNKEDQKEEKEEQQMASSSNDDVTENEDSNTVGETPSLKEEEERLLILERKLKEYIDIKIATLQESMETQYQELYNTIDKRLNEMYTELTNKTST